MPVSLNTPVGILSYPHLFKARSVVINGKAGDPKFGAVLLLKPEDCRVIEGAIRAAAEEKWATKAADGLLHGRLASPLKKGETKDDPNYHGKMFLSCNSSEKPSVLTAHKPPRHITDPKAIYPGMHARLNVTFKFYENEMKKGVGCYLNHVQIIAAGERLDSRKSGEDAFADDANFDGFDVDSVLGAYDPFGGAPANPADLLG
jgi:hypothetical protein